MTVLSINSELHCQIDRHIPAWKMGTGVKISLKPGVYQITGDDLVAGVIYLTLDNSFRIDKRDLEVAF